MFNNLLHCLKLTLITGILAGVSHLVYAGPPQHEHAPPPLTGVNNYKYKVGDKGPGRGWIFFVDYYDQYRDFTYLEAAPTDIAYVSWCNDMTNSILGAAGWAANAVGRGRANTNAMLAICSTGAAVEADNYKTPTTHAGDWFLPSEGELMLMYTNLRQAGVGGFTYNNYWSSTELVSIYAGFQSFDSGVQSANIRSYAQPVRAVRAF